MIWVGLGIGSLFLFCCGWLACEVYNTWSRNHPKETEFRALNRRIR